jgi:hypothetical protein
LVLGTLMLGPTHVDTGWRPLRAALGPNSGPLSSRRDAVEQGHDPNETAIPWWWQGRKRSAFNKVGSGVHDGIGSAARLGQMGTVD